MKFWLAGDERRLHFFAQRFVFAHLIEDWRISSSRLSFRSLCPRTAVTSFFFSRVSSILVGFTWVPATAHHTFP